MRVLAARDHISHRSDESYDGGMQSMTSTVQSVDSSPKWFTQIEFDLQNHWTESTIEYAPRLDYDDSAFTRVVITNLPLEVTPSSTLAASA